MYVMSKNWMILVAVLLFGCERESVSSKALLPVYTVSVEHPVVKDVKLYHEWIGRLEAGVSAEVLPHVEGYVAERLFVNGQVVKEGEPLYRLDDKLYAEALAQAQQQESEAAAAALEAQQNVDYYRPLVQEGAVARQSFSEAQRQSEAADAALAAAKAAVAQAQTNVDYCTLLSPMTGIVGFAHADVGSYVSPASAPMVLVNSVNPMRVSFSISEQDWLNQGGMQGSLRPGAEVELILANGEVYDCPARISGVDNVVASDTGTLKIDAMVANPESLLRPGMFVDVRAEVGSVKNAVLVSRTAIISQQGKQFVAAVESDGKVVLIPVVTGVSEGEWIVVKGALTPQTQVVVSGTLQAMLASSGRAKLNVLRNTGDN